MKKISLAILITVCCFKSTVVFSQSHNFCGQHIVTETILKSHPEWRCDFEKTINNNQCQDSQTGNILGKIQSAPMYTIPMVFHILHTGGAENISDAQVIDQVAILNRDYQKQNQDTALIVPSFTNNIANVGIAFKLATIDPQGNCTNGIIRHYTTDTDWDANDLSKFVYSWPRDKYLNIYVVKTINIAATAYAFLPGTPIQPDADVIVALHQTIGAIGTGNVLNSRTLTHEAGHWMNLQHIWGTSNQPGVACGDDQVGDTPITKGFITCSTTNTGICTPGVVENVQNYMDYAPCKIMFTNGQASRMISCLTGTLNNRQNISSPSNLLATGVTTFVTNCIPLVEINAAPAKTICVGGTMSLFSYTSNANATNYLWSGSVGATITNPTLAITTVSFSNVGDYTITCAASNVNGSSTASVLVTAKNNTTQVLGNYSESFESLNLPANWTINNPNTVTTKWGISNVAASLGGQSMFVNAETAPIGSVEMLESPSYDFLNNQGATFTFKTAYARQTATHNDVFKVQASKDCGGSWTDIYVPGPANLCNGSGGVTSTLFTPTAAQWKLYDLTQHPNFFNFLNESNVQIRFYFKEDPDAGFGNRIYLDEVNFDLPVGISELAKDFHLNIYPNPVKDVLSVKFDLQDNEQVKISLFNILGSEVIANDLGVLNSGSQTIKVNLDNKLSPGIYFLNVDINELKVTKKIIVV